MTEENNGQLSLFDDNADYNSFVEKFEPKKTTDDCYTPENIFDAIADWVAAEYGLDKACFVRERRKRFCAGDDAAGTQPVHQGSVPAHRNGMR